METEKTVSENIIEEAADNKNETLTTNSVRASTSSSSSWTANIISADAASKLQIGAGILVKNINIASSMSSGLSEISNENIICETTGDFSITCIPETQDFFGDVNNAPRNTKEGKKIIGWNCGLTVSAISIDEDVLLATLGAADVASGSTDKTRVIIPRNDYISNDFKEVCWIGDLSDSDKVFVIRMRNTVSTGGISFTSTNNGKGSLSLTLMPHTSMTDSSVPMEFIIMTKI